MRINVDIRFEFSPKELEDYGKQLRTGLLAVVGVAKVALHGLQRKAIFVEISRERAAALGVSINKLYTDLAQQNSVVLVEQMDIEIKEGKPRFDAVVDSAASRVRPVTMGALTTAPGVIPLFCDAFFKSMAVVLVFGLTFAPILTLVVAPTLYAVFFRIRSDERGSHS